MRVPIAAILCCAGLLGLATLGTDASLPGTGVAWAQTPAAEDSTLEGFLGGLSDSTDRYFGLSAAPLDTAGLDSALAYGLDNPRSDRSTRALAFSVLPDFTFNRVNGPVWGARAGFGRPAALGQIYGEAGYAAGPNDWLGGGGVRRSWRIRDGVGSLDLFAGRRTAIMERERSGRYLSSMRALFFGNDRRHYYRRDGFESTVLYETALWRAGIGYRDMLESPLATTATWNLAKSEPDLIGNLPAALGRAREISVQAAWQLPVVPFTAEIRHATSGDAIGSDFEYRRTRFALSGDFGLGDLAAVVPQLAYGRLRGAMVPQQAFYLGGSHSLRSMPSAALGGTGMALARIDVIGAHDVLALARIPHPDMFPIQFGVFGGIGAAWGDDPYGGPGVDGIDWPERRSWMSEVGAALIYQPGIPDPTLSIRLNYAHPLGPGRETDHWSISIARALDLVKPFAED